MWPGTGSRNRSAKPLRSKAHRLRSRTTAACELSAPPPNAGQPRLLLARQSFRPVVMLQLAEARRAQQRAPAFQVVVGAVALALPAFLIVAAGVGTEQRATGF